MTESMRGMRLGSQSMEREEGVELALRRIVSYRCTEGHESNVTFALDAESPTEWECRHCKNKALLVGGVELAKVEAGEIDKPRTHYDMVLERRSKAELEELLQEVLADMRKRRSAGKLSA
jgi:hypothetical protein